MDFTFDAYLKLIELVKISGYEFRNYHDYKYTEKCVIMRHDIDNSIEKALQLAKIENSEHVSATYFVLLNTDFYNVASKKSLSCINEIVSLGHEIGLHFDETAYGCEEIELKHFIAREARILSDIIDYPVTTFSMHRPNQRVLNSNLVIPGLVNAYGHPFFDEFKYLSDSRRTWRESVEEIVKAGKYKRLQILTHAFWYYEHELSLSETVRNYIGAANDERKLLMSQNIKDLDEIINN